MLLSACQRQELISYLLDSQKQQNNLADSPCIISETYKVQTIIDEPFTEIRIGNLYFCQEQRLVCIGKQVIELTAKEFDILALLITHPKRVFTYELIMELVWNEEYSYYSRKAVNNHVSNLRKKLKTTPGFPDYEHYVIGFVEDGKRVLSCRDREYAIEEGSIVLFGPGDSHACAQSDEGTFDYRGFNITKEIMLNLAEEVTGKRELPGFSKNVIYDGEVACHLRPLHEMVMRGTGEFQKEEALLFLRSHLIQNYGQPFRLCIPECRQEIERAC